MCMINHIHCNSYTCTIQVSHELIFPILTHERHFSISAIDSPLSSSITSLPTIHSILSSQPTANIILPKQLFCTSTITSPRQCNRITEWKIKLTHAGFQEHIKIASCIVSRLHSFIPGLKPSLSASSSHHSLFMFMDTSEHICIYFLVFFHFLVFSSMQQIKLTNVSFWAIPSRIISYSYPDMIVFHFKQQTAPQTRIPSTKLWLWTNLWHRNEQFIKHTCTQALI